MARHDGTRQPAYADIRRVGLPRALLYYRYGVLWQAFLEALGRDVVVSRPTDRAILERGDMRSADECCLASKLYIGHVDALLGACDAVFVPSMDNVGTFRTFCTKFASLPDLVANTFADEGLRVVSCRVDAKAKLDMRSAFFQLALEFGADKSQAKRAVKQAWRAAEGAEAADVAAQERVLHERAETPEATRPLAILLAAHPYVAHDAYLGGAIVELLERLGVCVLFSDACERERAVAASERFSATMPWVVNREICGSIMLLSEHVDGIVLVSAFPCGPDSMTDDAIVRCMHGTPILNLTIDAQSGTAGLETRIESFVDILRYQKRGGYVHGT